MEAMEQEINPFASINETVAEEPRIPISEYLFVITQFVHFVTIIVSLSAQIFLIVVIRRYKRLKTRTNLLLLNLLAVGVVYYVVTALFFLFDIFGLWYFFLLLNIVFQIQSTALMLYVVFAVLLATDWILGGLKREFAEKLRRRDKLIYSLIYLTSLLELVVTVAYVEWRHFVLRLLVTNFVYLACTSVMIALNVLRHKMAARIDANSAKTEYSFDVSNVVIFFMLPCFLWNVSYFFVQEWETLKVLSLLNVVPSIAWMAHPVFLAYKLGVWDKKFKMAYMKALRRSSTRDYDDDGLDEEETECDERVLVSDAEGQLETVI